MAITTRQQLADFCIRQLGGGVINIEITPDQIDDAIEVSLEWYTEFHYDGIERDYLAHRITGTSITIADASNFSVGQYITCAAKSLSASILSKNGNTIVVGRATPYGQVFAANDTITTPTASATIISIALGDIDNGWIVADDGIVGVLKVLNLTSVMGSSEMLFNANYQIMMSEIQSLTSGSTNYYYSTMNYMGHLDYIMRKEKDFRFNRRMNKIFLDINWSADVAVGDVVVIEVYRALDDASYPRILGDRWLKAYTTAQIKKQWGQNLKKYSGMQLPGGLTYNGQTIYDEALVSIAELESEAINSSAPLGFAVG